MVVGVVSLLDPGIRPVLPTKDELTPGLRMAEASLAPCSFVGLWPFSICGIGCVFQAYILCMPLSLVALLT